MDVQDWMRAQYNTYFSNKVSENETPSAVKSDFWTDMSMDVEKRMFTHYNTNSTHTMCGNYRTAAVKSGFSAAMSMDVENRMNTQYYTNSTHTMCENEANCAVDATSEFSTNMVFKSHKDLTDWVKTKGRSLGYAIIIRRTKKEANGVMYNLTLTCDRGGIDKSKNSTRNKTSKKISCPFQLVGKYLKRYDSWRLQVRCGKHNHEPALDMEGHPHAMGLSDKETRLVVHLLRKGLKPRAILSILKQQYPDNLSTIKTIYNALQKLRKTGHAETLMGDMVNDEETVSLSPEFTPYAFDAKGMKETVDHTAPFATGNRVQGFDPGRPFQPYRDVVFYKPEGQFLNDSLEEDGLQSDVNFDGLADIWNEMNKSMDIEEETNSQYNTNFTQTVCENERTHAVNSTSEFSTNMVFRSHQDLKHWVQIRGRSLGYVIVTKKSNLSSFVSKVTLMCDRNGISKSTSSATNRNTRKTNCPFKLKGKYRKMHNYWTLRVICEKHNHEPALDMKGHPYAQRLSDNEKRLVMDLSKKDVKPKEILLTLKEKNPNNESTLKTIYNALQKIRKTGYAETITGQMANGEASVSPSPPYTPCTFYANQMKQTVDHTNPFAVRNLVQGFDSAKHGSVTGQIPMPCFRTFPPLQTDLTQNPVKEVSNANLVRDMFMFDNKREREFLIKQFLEGDYAQGQSSGGQTNTAVESRDKEDKNVDCDLEIIKKHDKHEYVGVQSNSDMEENESSDVNFDGLADIRKDKIAGLGSSKSTDVKDQLNTWC